MIDSTEKALETLLIDTPSKDPTTWKGAVMECANLYYVEIEVQIHDSREVQCNISQVLGNYPELLEALNQVQPAIFEEIRRICLERAVSPGQSP